jgi:hypothetical protein
MDKKKDSNPNPNPNLLWGTYTWIMFHWLAEHINESEFRNERDNIINHIYLICNNLPCPKCREHAIEYLKSNRLSIIRTKEDLKTYLHHFHNCVNKRGKKKYEDYTVLEKYKTLNFNLLLQLWNKHFTLGSNINNNDFMAKKNIQKIKSNFILYIQKNHYKFFTN